MSGFAGIISPDGAMPDAQLLERMAHTLAFRGPDSTHIKTMPGAGFCFTFLRTGPAPQCPSQPCSLDGNVWLLGDVRLDGRDDLRRKLKQHGDEFDGEVTDEELVLRVWRRWHEDVLPDLIGDYSFVLWDARARELWCARDLMGARPFFYAQAGNWLYVSNTLAPLRCVLDVSKDLDQRFIGDFLLDGWSGDPERTAFRSISRLPAGHALHFSPAGIKTHRFTTLPIEEPLSFKRAGEYVEVFRELLMQALHDRLPSTPVAISLSGGLDSTSVAAFAVRSAEERALPLTLAAYTFDYRPLFADEEGPLASLVAQHLGIPIHIVACATTLPFANRDLDSQGTPEPCHEPYWSLYLQQSVQIAQRGRLILTGHGGDAILTGQSWPYLSSLLRRAKFATIANVFGSYVLEHRRIPPLRGGFRSALRRFPRVTDPMAGYPKWLSPQFEKDLRLQDRWVERQRPEGSNVHPWHPQAYSVLSGSFWPGLLEGEDAAWNKVAVESRAPLLDTRILRFLLRVPPVPLCLDKELLREAARGLLPEQIRSRPKTPFAGDQLALHLKSGVWKPLPLPQSSVAISTFIDLDKLNTTLRDTPIQFPWADLRPLSLLYWLQVLERN